jgi:hypothetical protein
MAELPMTGGSRRPLDAEARRMLAMSGPFRLMDDLDAGFPAGGCSGCHADMCPPGCIPEGMDVPPGLAGLNMLLERGA